MEITKTYKTTFGWLEFTFSANGMSVLNTETGETLCYGEIDRRIWDGGDNEEQAAQEWAEEFYREED